MSRSLLPLLALALATTVSACADDEPESAADDQSSLAGSEQPVDPSADAVPSDDNPARLPAACDVVSADDVAEVYGVELSAPEPGTGEHGQQELDWTSDDCSWEAEDLLEVELALTDAEDFALGELVCPPLLGIGGEVSQVRLSGARSAEWEVSDGGGGLEATLRVCTASGNFDIEVDYEDGTEVGGDPKQQTVRLGRMVLEGLPL